MSFPRRGTSAFSPLEDVAAVVTPILSLPQLAALRMCFAIAVPIEGPAGKHS